MWLTSCSRESADLLGQLAELGLLLVGEDGADLVRHVASSQADMELAVLTSSTMNQIKPITIASPIRTRSSLASWFTGISSKLVTGHKPKAR